MSKGAYSLGDVDRPTVRLCCPQCHRFAQFKRTKLLQRFGPDQNMPPLLRQLKPCNVGNSFIRPAMPTEILGQHDARHASRSHHQGQLAGDLEDATRLTQHVGDTT
jgi:hypothetical protein